MPAFKVLLHIIPDSAPGLCGIWVIALAILLGTGCTTGPTATARDQFLYDARLARAAGNYHEARMMSELALEELPGDREAAQFLASIFREVAEDALEEGNLELARGALEDAARYEPSRVQRADDLFRAARAGHQRGDEPRQLIKLLEDSVEDDPTVVAPRRLLGAIFDDLGEAEAAALQYRWILDMGTPEHNQLAFRLAQLYQQLEHYREAELLLEELMERDEANIQAHLLYANLHAQMGRTRAARVLYEALMQRFPGNPAIMMRFASFLDSVGDRSRADVMREMAREHMPGVERRELRQLR